MKLKWLLWTRLYLLGETGVEDSVRLPRLPSRQSSLLAVNENELLFPKPSGWNAPKISLNLSHREERDWYSYRTVCLACIACPSELLSNEILFEFAVSSNKSRYLFKKSSALNSSTSWWVEHLVLSEGLWIMFDQSRFATDENVPLRII